MGALIAGWRLKAVVWSVAVAAVGYLAFSLWGGWREVLAAVGQVGLGGVVIVLLLSMTNYCLRFLRWQAYLRALGTRVPTVESFRIYLAGFALTTTPGKAGEALRGIFLKPYGLSYTQSIAAFLSERISDLIAIVLLVLMGLSAYPQGRGWVVFAGIAIVGFLFAISREGLLKAVQRATSASKGWCRALHHVFHLLLEARRCHNPKLLLSATALSVTAWSAEAFAFHLLMVWLNCPVDLSQAFFIYAFSMLVGALSFLPGGLGGTEVVMMGLLIAAGTPPAEAVAATVLIRLATLWLAVGLGIVALLRSQTTLKESDG